MNRKLLLLTFVLLVAGTLAACAAGGGGYYVARTPPPPPAAYGVVGMAPGPGYVWVNGYWDWRGGNYFWVRGSWVLPPRRGAVWIAPAYRPYRNGYRYQAGRWR